jgi:N-acetylglucosamine-6-sulfatase
MSTIITGLLARLRNRDSESEGSSFLRKFVVAVIACSAVIGVATLVVKDAKVTPQAEAATKPNIVVIMLDDLDDKGIINVMKTVKTKLKDKGVTLKNSFVEFSTCCPSRATLLTGQHAQNHHVLNSATVNQGGYARLDGKGNTLPVWLKAAGYHTAHIGKYLNGYGSEYPPCPTPPGWDTWRGLRGVFAYRYYTYKALDEHCADITPRERTHQTDFLADQAVNFINSRATSSQPIFLSWAPLAPHDGQERTENNFFLPTPADRHMNMLPGTMPKPGSYDEADVSDKPSFVRAQPRLSAVNKAEIQLLYQRRRETLLGADEAIDRIITALANTKKLSNTYIIFTADNGFFHGEHRRLQGKLWVYENSIRVPLIIIGPGIPAGQTRNQFVLNTDLASTILDWAGVAPRRVQDGRSLKPVLASASAPWRTAFLVQGLNDTYAQPVIRAHAIHTNKLVYIEHTNGEKEFYNLVIDPNQMRNRIDDPAYETVRSQLRTRLASLRTCAGANCWVTETFSNIVTSTIDTASPAAAITAPAANATVAVSGTATDNVGVSKIELYLDAESAPKNTLTFPPR